MAYGTVKVDNITFTNGGIDQTVTVSGIVQSISGNITATGTIQAATIIGTSTVSGATVTGNAGVFTTVTGGSAGFTTVTGTTVTGTTANFATISGTTITGSVGNFGSGSAAAPSVSVGTTDNGLYSPGTDQVALSTNGTGRLFVDSLGLVSIGDSGQLVIGKGESAIPTNSVKAHIFWGLDSIYGGTSGDLIMMPRSSAAANFRIYTGSTTPSERFRITGTGQLSYIGAGSAVSPAVSFNGSAPSNSFVITSAGLVGIGTSSPDANSQLHIVGSSYQPLYVNTTGVGGGGATFFRSGTQALYVGTAGSSWLSGSSTADGLVRAEANLVLATNGNSRAVTIDSSQRVGIGTTSPGSALEVSTASNTGVTIRSGSITDNGFINFTDGAVKGQILYDHNGDYMRFYTNGVEAARIDSSGRLLIGTSSSVSVASLESNQQIFGSAPQLSITRGSNNASGATLALAKSRNTAYGSRAIVADGDTLGSIRFCGDDGVDLDSIGAQIAAQVDGTPGSNDLPSRLVFSVTADGASSPTEALRISNNRAITVSDGGNIVLGTGTGTKIGTSTSQKIGFFNETPIVQPTTGIAEAAFVENSGGTAVNVDSTFGGYTIQQVVQALQNLGLLA